MSFAAFPVGYSSGILMPNIEDVHTILAMDGANGSTTFTNSKSGGPAWSKRTIGPTVSTAQSVFGGSSASFTIGESDTSALTTASATANNLFSGSFLFTGWLRPDSVSDDRRIFCVGGTDGYWTGNLKLICQHNGTSLSMELRATSGGSSKITRNSSITVGAWNHVVFQFDRPSMTVGIGANGSITYTSVSNIQSDSSSLPACIGSMPYELYSYSYRGYMDSIVISTKPLYTEATYEVPIAPWF